MKHNESLVLYLAKISYDERLGKKTIIHPQ
jgi:hypothetical protein